MDEQYETDIKDNNINRLESGNDNIPKNSTKNIFFGLALWLSGCILGIYVFNNFVIGIGIGLLYWLSFRIYIRKRKK